MRFLVVEDDPAVQDAIAASLTCEWPADCSIAPAADGRSALESLGTFEPELVLLGIGLSGEDGYEVLSRIRRVSDVPIVVTGRRAEMDEVRSLQLGADDYVTKPFESSLLIARIRSLLRRSGRPARERGTADRVAGDLTIDFQTHEVTLRGERVKLTPVEYRLLHTLAQAPERLISHRTLIELVWGVNRPSTRGRLHVYVKRLKDKLATESAPFIENERGLGYRFSPPARL